MVAMQQEDMSDLRHQGPTKAWSTENTEISKDAMSQDGGILTSNNGISTSSAISQEYMNVNRIGEDLQRGKDNPQQSGTSTTACSHQPESSEQCKLNEKSLPADGPSESMADTVKLIAATTNISPGNDGPTNDNDKRIQENKTSSKNGHIVSPSSGDINHSFQALAPCANPISSQVSSAALNEEKIIFQEPPQSSPLLHFNVVKENLSVEGGSKNISTSNVPQSETCASSLIKPSNFIYDESDSTDAKHRSEDHTGSPSKFELSREYPKRRRSSVCPAPVVAVSKKRTASWCVLCERPTGDDYDQHLDEPGAVICRNYKCQRGFHIACLRNAGYSASTINLDSFLCLNCSEKKILCLECQHAINDDNFIRCSVSACGNRFHSSCWKWEDKQCPRHVCKKCVDKEVRCGSESFNLRSDRYDCLRCSTSYHASCIPKSAVRLVLGHHPNKFVCERHEVLPNSIRWRPPLIIPLWVGVSTLKELSFSLSPEWLNGDAGNDEESVIILPEILGGSHPSHSESPKNNLDARRSGIAETETNIKPKSKAKLWTKNRKSEGGDVKPVEASSSFFANFDFVPEFSLEPPLGFAMEPYKSRSRNIYTFPRPSQTSREAAHICSCSPGSNCADDSCFNRSLQIECDARFCPCGELCRNQRLQKREWQPMRLIFTKDRGCGMMSQVPIQAGDLVIEYVGEVLDEVSFRQRAQENTEKKRPQDNYYMMQLSRHLVIDARKTGNNARFLNHSCSPNCRTEIWEVAKGELRAGIFAMYDIPAGVELTYDYNFELFSKAVNSESVPCRCGASNCSKFLGVRPLRINSKK